MDSYRATAVVDDSLYLILVTKSSSNLALKFRVLAFQVLALALMLNCALDRQALKSELKGKTLSDETTLGSLGLSGDSTLYFKDLGPQIGWGTVFLAEYAGPLFVYLVRFKNF